MPWSGSLVTSTSVTGVSTPSRIRSTRFVPPPRNFASGLAIAASAVAVSVAAS
jgi:hypothetical protein